MDIDIERLKWDESLWPEGATYYIDPTGTAYDDKEGGKFCDQIESGAYYILPQRKYFWPDARGVLCIPRPTKPAAPEWDGTGKPPVGCECEFEYLEEGNWVDAKVIGYDGPACVVALDGYGYQGSQLDADFRPIRTQADRERDEIIECIRQLRDTNKPFCDEDIASAIIAAGFRKGNNDE